MAAAFGDSTHTSNHPGRLQLMPQQIVFNNPWYDYKPPITKLIRRPALKDEGFMTYRAEEIPWGTEVDMPSALPKRRKKTYMKQSYNALQAVVKKLPGQYKSIARKDYSNPATKHEKKRQPALPQPVDQNPPTKERIIVNKFPLTTGIVVVSEARDNFKLSTSIVGAKEEKEVNFELQQKYSKKLCTPSKRSSMENLPPANKSRTAKPAVPKFMARPGIKVGAATSGKLIPPSAKSKKRLDAALLKIQAEKEQNAKIRKAERARDYDDKIRGQWQQGRKSRDQQASKQAPSKKKVELSQSQSAPGTLLPQAASKIQRPPTPYARPTSRDINTARVLTQRLEDINEKLSGARPGKSFEKNSDSFKAWQARKTQQSSRNNCNMASGFSSTAGSVVAMSTCRQLDSRKSSNRHVKMPRPF